MLQISIALLIFNIDLFENILIGRNYSIFIDFSILKNLIF